ncbi:MAG: hypothetical protein ABR974_13510 [Bacteroidales bacterium]|jgi:hypothetical protein
MKFRLLLIIAFSGAFALCQGQGQENSKWDKWSWLMGAWKGEGSGKPGQGEGTFAFSFDLNSEVIMRRSHSEYPALQDKPAIVHDDLMIIYHDQSGSQDKAIYFDNEGHTINYTVSFGEKSIILKSERSGKSPVFRLVYTLLDNDRVNTSFDMSQDGENFSTYIQGISKRIK